MGSPLAKLTSNAGTQAAWTQRSNKELIKRPQESVPAAPIVSAEQLSPNLKGTCANCSKNKAVTELHKCALCLSSLYCDRECQKAHWKIHKEECTMPIQSPKPRVPKTVARLRVEKLEEAASSMQISESRTVHGGGAGGYVFQSAWKTKPKGPRPSPSPRVQSQRSEGQIKDERPFPVVSRAPNE